jgi:hypothetical protein
MSVQLQVYLRPIASFDSLIQALDAVTEEKTGYSQINHRLRKSCDRLGKSGVFTERKPINQLLY